MPISAWQVASAWAVKLVPPPPSRTRQMSPGISRIMINTSVAAPSSVGITRSMRFIM